MTIRTISGTTFSQVNLFDGDALIVTTTGSINVVSATYAVFSGSNTTCSIDNSGSIVNTSISSVALAINISGVVLNNLTNNGLISSAGANSILISSPGPFIDTFTNVGTIRSTGGGAFIKNTSGFINIFNNLQSGLTFSGNVPDAYTIIINSLTQYGQLFCSGNNTNTMTFGIYTPSTLSSGSYTSVLTGITANKLNNISGTYGLYNWSLLVRDDGTTWDLQVISAQTAACTSQPGGPDPPRLWSRAMTTCMTSVPVNALNMRRKAEILKYKANSAQLTKKQQWAQIVHGGGPLAKKVWANQNALGSNPNIEKLPLVGNVLQCNGPPLVQCSASTACDVPGPTTQLCDDPNVPLVNYIVQRTYLAGGTKFPQTCWAPGDNGFPVGKAGKLF
jgi:hypothetical protein